MLKNLTQLGRYKSLGRTAHSRGGTRLSSTFIADAVEIGSADESRRRTGAFFVSNVLPIRLGRFDFRSVFASLEEATLLDQLEGIAHNVNAYGWRVEGLEISRKDGGVFLNYSYIPPTNAEGNPTAFSSARAFLPLLSASAQKQGGFPHWLGKWYASTFLPGPPHLAASAVEEIEKEGVAGEESSTGTSVSTDSCGLLHKGGKKEVEKGGRVFGLGDGRCWAVRGKQWTEDLDRFSSSVLRVEFDGPDVSQEVLYELFRPYGRVSNIVPPSPVPAGSLRFATISYTRLSPSTIAINVLHGLSTPTNTRDYTLVKDAKTSGSVDAPPAIPRTRLRLFYERTVKAHAFRDWLTSHPRLTIPALAFLIGTLSYTFFDPIRKFFVQAHVEGLFKLDDYSSIKWLRSKVGLPSGIFGSKDVDSANGDEIGRGAWQDRIAAEKQMLSWLSESPGTFITVTGPPGSGKASLVSRVIQDKNKKALYIDCTKIAKAKTDSAVIDELAGQTGYWPVFSFMSNISGLIDLAAVGLIGQKAGFAAPLDQQIKQVLEVVASSLKETSESKREGQVDAARHAEEAAARETAKKEREVLIRRGGWHDGRLDCIAGSGIMSELGFGDEVLTESDMGKSETVSGVDVAGLSLDPIALSAGNAKPLHVKKQTSEVDTERNYTESLPILVLDNFTQKINTKTEIWNTLAEWGAGLVENKIAHVIVVCDSSSAAKALTRALPSKPLNAISLADADRENSMAYVVDKLGVEGSSLSLEETTQIEKIGGRMVDLELLVYKVRSGLAVKEAVDDIITRNVVELRKAAFGDDADDAKTLPWTRAQAWKIVSQLAKKRETPYTALLQDFPFKGNEAALRALEDHDMIAVSFVDGRPSMVRAGKPLYRHVFERLANDSVFAAATQIEYNTALIATAETTIRTIEEELLRLKEIDVHSKATESAWSIDNYFGKSATEARIEYLLTKMKKAVDSQNTLEADVAKCKVQLLNSK